MLELQTYITVKDHHDYFCHSISCRLTNQSKTDTWKISNAILNKINVQLLSFTKVNQLENSDFIINWFKNIPEKKTCILTVFDIENFYPSISLEPLNKAL